MIQYSISQRIDRLYTWNGVSGSKLNEQLKNQIESRMKAETEKQKAEDEVEKVYEAFDEDLRSLQDRQAFGRTPAVPGEQGDPVFIIR